MYQGLLLFPCFPALRFERALVRVKRLWNVAQPRYHWFTTFLLCWDCWRVCSLWLLFGLAFPPSHWP